MCLTGWQSAAETSLSHPHTARKCRGSAPGGVSHASGQRCGTAALRLLRYSSLAARAGRGRGGRRDRLGEPPDFSVVHTHHPISIIHIYINSHLSLVSLSLGALWSPRLHARRDAHAPPCTRQRSHIDLRWSCLESWLILMDRHAHAMGHALLAFLESYSLFDFMCM